jgi:hypothetical protein
LGQDYVAAKNHKSGSETIQRNSQFEHVTMTIENKIKLTISTDEQTIANIYKLFQLA